MYFIKNISEGHGVALADVFEMMGVIAIMRKMLLLVYTLWKSGEEYDESRDKTNVQINN